VAKTTPLPVLSLFLLTKPKNGIKLNKVAIFSHGLSVPVEKPVRINRVNER
jgi:hypothetical protein